ncbi:MAG: iron-containing alcohol dehydrogenase [Verrucomicrobia subdivision 3 bacterium]|nr:iron-containing alcohol dehydrogenase [Limisphaerales bacterium]
MTAPVSGFAFPTPTIFGPGAIAELPTRLKQMGCKRPLVVTDPGLLQTQAFHILTNTLGAKGLGQTWDLFHGVHSNPIEQDVVDAAKAFRESACDSVIAFGGGSALDVGKACRLVVKRPDLKLSRFNTYDDWSGLARCVCIPTTAGTGSEVGRSSVITLAGTQRRSVIFLPRLMAKLVVLDPEVTLDLPPLLTAATGIDALTHCIESFTSPTFQPFCDGVALEGIHYITEALPRAVKDGKDIDARGKMLVAAAMGGVAFQKDLGATHSLAHPLSAMCGMHHGTANAICLPPVMEFNAQRKPGLYRRVGIACGLDVMRAKPEDADRKVIDYIKKFIANVGIVGGLRENAVLESQVDALSAQAYADTCHLTNPVPVTREDLRALYQAAL